MTADVTCEPTGGQELREAIARAIWERMPDEPYQSDADAAADAVLALPEVAALIADADRVKRVREMIRFYDRHEYSSLVVDDLRRALDGEDRT